MLQTARGAMYCIAQRAEHIWEGVSSATTRSRPIINTRDEPHADAERYRRLHVIVGDSNMSEYATFLKVGATSILLRMLEDPSQVLRDLTLENPIRAIREISHDTTCRRKVRLANGRELSALDIQSEYLAKALKYAETKGLSPLEKQALGMWEHCVTTIERDPMDLDRECDWVIKHKLIEGYRAKHDLPLTLRGDVEGIQALLHRPSALDYLHRNFRGAVQCFFDVRRPLGLGTLVGRHHVVEGFGIAVDRGGEEGAVVLERSGVLLGEAGHHGAERRGHGGRRGGRAAASGSGGRRGEGVQEVGKAAAGGEGLGDPILEDQLGAKVFVAEEVLGGELDRPFRDEADNLAPDHRNAPTLSLATHGLEDHMHRRLLEIGQIDRNLGDLAGFQEQSHRFHIPEAPTGVTDGLGNLLRDRDVRCPEIDVVSDQELACADDGRAGGGVADGISAIGIARLDRAHFHDQRLELAAADILEIGPLRPLRGGLVEIDRDFQPGPDFLGHALGQTDALLDRDAFDRDKRDDVSRADPGMRALMPSEVDEGDRLFDRADRGVGDRGRRADEGEDGAIVVRVLLAVEQDHFGDGEDAVDDRIDFGGVAPLGEIRHALDELSRHNRYGN